MIIFFYESNNSKPPSKLLELNILIISDKTLIKIQCAHRPRKSNDYPEEDYKLTNKQTQKAYNIDLRKFVANPATGNLSSYFLVMFIY